MDTSRVDEAVVSAINQGKPFEVYKKTILGKALVRVLNPFNHKEEERLLEGNPDSGAEDCFIKLWSMAESEYFKNYNRKHLQSGVLVKVEQAPQPVERSANAVTDEELDEMLNSPFFTLQNALNKFTSTAPVFRLEKMATEQEKSEKMLNAIRARLSELQELELRPE